MDVVTGSFGYIGRHITRHLLDLGREVRTLTTHSWKPNPFGDSVEAFPYFFEEPDRLTRALEGAETLYNTYWIRFEYGGFTYARALENTHTLFRAAAEAGVRRIVHVSVTCASPSSDLPYYRGKGVQEEILAGVGVPYAIVRPTLVFGPEEILLNNIAWLMRRFPIFPVFRGGDYRLQPVFVDDLAELAVDLASAPSGTVEDAAGPETLPFVEFLRLLRSSLGLETPLLPVSPRLGILLGQLLGRALGDVLLTRDELEGLMREHLVSPRTPLGRTRLSDWLISHSSDVGAAYTSELRRHFTEAPP